MPLSYEVRHYDGVKRVRVLGAIDGNLDPGALAAELVGGDALIVVDTSGATAVTSAGVRAWLELVQSIDTTRVFLVGCRQPLIVQLNSVPRFGGRAQLVSAFIPCRCEGCDERADALFDVRTAAGVVVGATPAQSQCAKCGAAMHADRDEVDETWFSWSSKHAADPRSLPPLVAALIDGALDDDRQVARFRIAKHVEPELTALWLSGHLGSTARLRRTLDGVEGMPLFVLADLIVDDDAGLARLADAVDALPGAFLARLPPALAAWAAGAGARVVSIEAKGRCEQCRTERAVDVTDWWNGPPASGVACPLCGSAVDVPWSDRLTVDVARVTVVPCPPAAAHYLSAHPETHEARSSVAPGVRVGKYEIVRRIGRGGMAEVFLGKQRGIEGFEKRVVIKRILPHLAVQPRFVQMFTQEAKLAARISDARIAQVLDFYRDQDELFLVMEYVEGTDLHALIRLAMRRAEPLPIGVCVRIIADVCSALHAAHSYVDDHGRADPIIHRDVSPQNVLVGTDARAKLTDFGIAKASDSSKLTATGVLRGKLMYMAPELVNSGTATCQSDVFAAGLVLYQALTLTHPFRGRDESALINAVLEAPIPSLRELRPESPSSLVDVVHRAIARDPQARFASARELGDALEEILGASRPLHTSAEGVAWLARALARANPG